MTTALHWTTTMQLQATAMTGPDFLQAVADAERANGNDINAEAFETRARQWRAEQRHAHELDAALRTANDRLHRIADSARIATCAG